MCLQCKSRVQCVLLRVLYSSIYGVVDVLCIVPNQEKVCEEATSFDLTSLDIAYCIADVDYLLQMKKEELVEGDGGMYYRRDHRSISSPPSPSLFTHSLISSFPPLPLLPSSFPHLTTESTSDDDFKALLNLKGKMATWLCHIQHICVEAFNLRQKPILNIATLHYCLNYGCVLFD